MLRVSMCTLVCCFALANIALAADYTVTEDEQEIKISTGQLQAVVRKQGYVTGIAGGSLVDKQSGFHDVGFGLDIVDWIMEPGSDEAYREELPEEMVYKFNNAVHGKIAKRSIEGPQICTKAKALLPEVVRGDDFVAVKQAFRYQTAAPGKTAGSTWTQWIVFPQGQRYCISADRIDAVNSSPAMFLRLDLPGHIKHQRGDTFSEVYLSYHGKIPASEFFSDFAPDAKFRYQRDEHDVPRRMIRAYHLRDPKSGKDGPWLAGMTLNAADVSEAWCHQRGYVCMIEEIGGRRIEAGQSFSAAFVIGFFDSIEQMEEIYDQYAGHSGLAVSPVGWTLTNGARP